MNSIKLSDFFELKNPTYKYVRVIPHKSIRNYNSSNIAKAITYTYQILSKRLHKEKGKYRWLKTIKLDALHKISYVIDIEHGNASFYFIVPTIFLPSLLEKMREIWSKATIEVIEEGLRPFSNNSTQYSLSYKKEDALSLQVDKKSNEPLNSLLSVMEIMKDDDRITIIYNFMPTTQFGWKDQYEATMKKIIEKKCIDKKKMSVAYVLHNSLVALVNALESVLNVVNDFLGNSNATGSQESLMTSIMGVLERQNDLSIQTKKKKEATILNTQIGVVSYSQDDTRKINNAMSTCQAYRVLDEDNELVTHQDKKVSNIEDYSITEKYNMMSCDEASNFIQIPGRMLLTQMGIKHIKVEEVKVPEKLQKGYFCLGEAKFKGSNTKAYLENEYNKGNLPLVLIGEQGSGKSEYIKNIAKYCSDNNEGVIVLDFIKSCNLSESISAVIPKDKIVKIDLAYENDMQGIGYNEIQITDNMTPFKRMDLASNQTQQILNLIDSITGEALSIRMRRFLSSAAKVVFASGHTSLKDVINCLENYYDRKYYIQAIPKDMMLYLGDEIKTLGEIDEYSKPNKDNPAPEVIGTNYNKIEHILDRVGMLREDFKLKFMYDHCCDDNINLVECMNEGKVVLIQMKEEDFPTKMQKNILITYWVSKVWLTSQIRGGQVEKPLRCNFIIDEIFQAPTSLKMMEYIIPQSRKFGLHTILSTQYINQLDTVFESLEASGSSFMLFRGANEDDFNHFKGKFSGLFEYEDLRDMERFSSMNLINYSDGYASFITKLPKPVNE